MILALLAMVPVGGDGPVDFGRDVLPILSEYCFDCHGPDAAARKGDLRLDAHDDVLFVVEPGAPEESELLARLVHENPKRLMPPPSTGKAPTAAEREVLRRWIEEGAVWAGHWSFEAVEAPLIPAMSLPSGELAGWDQDPLDLLVLHRLGEQGMSPSPPAGPAIWLRRVHLDLTGLPPTLEQLDAFLSGEVTDAEVVDGLLASDARAEHRTREWLDLARYADTNGYQNDFRRDQWPWRDWVLGAFAANMPYDRFVMEQVAGDLIEGGGRDAVLATGFQRNHRTVTEAGSIDEEWRVENVADRAETSATAFLGLTVACARCHDHRYDPISQVDYYRFFGFFDQVDEKGVYSEVRGNVAPILRVPSAEQEARLDALAAQIAGLEGSLLELEQSAADRHAAFRAEGEGVAQGGGEPGEAPLLEVEGALVLDGTRANAPDLGRSVEFEQDRPFTVSLWLRPDAHGAVFSRMEDTDRYRGVDLVLLEGMRPAVHLIHDWDRNAIKVVGQEPLVQGAWHHVAVTYDGSRKAAGVSVFINGVQAGLKAEVDRLDGTLATEEPLRVGTRRYAGHLAGEVRDLRVDGRVLGSGEVLALARERASAEGGVRFFLAAFDGEAAGVRRRLARTRGDRARLERDEIPTAMVLRDREVPRETRLLRRGEYDHPEGEVLTPDVPEIFGGLPDGARRDRLGLARWLVAPTNPLTARVAVNRTWASFFGRGLVATVEDFGIRGARPEHPALLDHLAADLVASGWDLRALERRIALSATYRQTSEASAAARERDPDNGWLARGPRHRLDAEGVRDQALLASGLLVQKVGGPSVKPYQPAGLWKELAGGAGQGAYVESTGDDLFRRSLYTYRKRTVPHPQLTTFDAPGFELCTARRPSTNTPLQALALLNGPTYQEASRHLAKRMLTAEGEEARLTLGMRAVLSRGPTGGELEVLKGALGRYRREFEADSMAAVELLGVGATATSPRARTPEWAAYTMIASTLLNLDEAITQR